MTFSTAFVRSTCLYTRNNKVNLFQLLTATSFVGTVDSEVRLSGEMKNSVGNFGKRGCKYTITEDSFFGKNVNLSTEWDKNYIIR